MCGIQDVISKGKVDETVYMFYGMIRTAGREMTKLQSSKNGITGIMSNVHIKRQALKPH
jgi:cyanate lyase